MEKHDKIFNYVFQTTKTSVEHFDNAYASEQRALKGIV